MLNRFGTGFTPKGLAALRAAGGPRAWLERQMHPAKVRENAKTKALITWFPDQRQSAGTKWDRNQTRDKSAWVFAKEFGNWSELRRIHSNRQVHETMVDFWSNHFHVNANSDLAWVHRFGYDSVIRDHAFGRFDDLLVAVSLHPAMLLFLDNWQSTRGAPNENQGRELLELHTVGRTSGYTEQMVKDSAKILSGYTVDVKGTWQGLYDKSRHTTGPVKVLAFERDNSAADGRQLTVDYLRYLAHHPATARTIARKLVLRFVSDAPNAALVSHLAKVYLNHGTDIRAVLRALVASKAYAAAHGKKVRTPIDDLVATARVLRVDVKRPRSGSSWAQAMTWMPGSLQLYQWPRPDGAPESNSPWCSATRMISSYQMHWNMTAGWYPTEDVRYRPPTAWLPQRRIRFDKLVDHLCRVMLGQRSTSKILKAACQAVDCRPGETISADHAVMSWLFVRLVGSLLDSPEHMTR